MGVLVHVPIPSDRESLEKTYHEWFPFLELVTRHTGEHEQQLLYRIDSGEIRLHLAFDTEAQKAVAIAGSMVLLQGEKRVGRVIWTAGLDRKRWMTLMPAFERYHKEYLKCFKFQHITRRGWIKDLKRNGYRVIGFLVEKVL